MKIYLIIILYLLLSNSVLGQLDVRLTSAFGKMTLVPETNLNINIGSGSYLTSGIQADYYLTKKLGVGIGADYYIQDIKYDVKLSDYSNQYRGIDNWEGDPVPRNYKFTINSNQPDIIEQNTLSILDIPLSVIYSIPIVQNVYLSTRLGMKLGIPLESKYILKESDLYTRLYFDEWDLELFNIPAHGLYDSRTDWHPEGEINLNRTFSIFSELGLDFPVSFLKVRLTGYFSYGLNNIIGEHQSSLIYWREDYNYILSLANSVRMIQLGVKLGVGIIGKKEKENKFKKNMKMCPAYW